MTENKKKALLIVIGVILIILVSIGIGRGIYYLNKDKQNNENINDKTENHTNESKKLTESEILKDAKSLNLNYNELAQISKELKNNIPFFSIYNLDYYDAVTGYNIFESQQEIYNFLVVYILRYDETRQNITDSDFVYYDDSDEIEGIKKEFVNKVINKIFAVEKIKDDTDNENYIIVVDGGGELGIQIKVTDKLYNSNTKEYFLKIEFVDEESGKKERTAILTYIEKDNQKLIKSFIYTSDIDNNQDSNTVEYDCDFNTGNAKYNEELKNHCEKIDEYNEIVYLSKEDVENYGWGENLLFTKNNLEKISEKIMYSLDGGTFEDASKLGGDNLRNILFDFLNPNSCGYYSKELLKDTYEYIFGQKINNVDSIAYEDELTNNFILKCDGRGSGYNIELVSHNDLEYFYKVEDAFEENPKPYYVKVTFKEENGRYYLVSVNKLTPENITSYGFKEININNISFDEKSIEESLLINFDKDKKDEYVKLNNGNSEVLFEGDKQTAEFAIKLINNVSYFTLGNEQVEIIKDVKNVYIQGILCAGERTINFLTNSGDIYKLEIFNVQYLKENLKTEVSNIKDEIKKELKKINNQLTYKDIMVWNSGFDTCGPIETEIGITNNNEKYIVEKETKLTEYYYNLIPDYELDKKSVMIYSNGDIKVDNKLIEYKFKEIYSTYRYNIILTQDNHLYDANNAKLLNDSKISKIYSLNNLSYFVIFENNDIVMFG